VVALAEVAGQTSAGEAWTLALASVHFENRGPGRPPDWVRGRAQQAQALIAELPESKLAVVGGDFNTLNGENEPAVRIVGARFANTATHPKNITYVSYVVVRSQLDYLFFQCAGSHRATYWRARSRYGSDHYPIMGFVRLKE
jgi:endonuclease/exonuclease/phosphatase family metal-dependent hydrolase